MRPGGRGGRSRLAPRLAVAALVAQGLSLAALPVQAGHGMNEGSGCYDCHDLNRKFAEPDTNYLGATKRNISSIKAAWAAPGNNTNGRNVPDEFGCLYCHNSPELKDDEETDVRSYRMRDASGHFRGRASMHPVGYDLAAGVPTDTLGHLLSTFDCYNGALKREAQCRDNGSAADGLGDRARELDCVDCHDVTQSADYAGYPQHGTPLAANPFMLRAGVGGHNLAAGEYDDVCRRCHGSAAGAGATGIASFKDTGRSLQLTAHPDASDTAANVMRESDGTLLKVADPDNDGVANAGLRSQCARCHAAHFSSTNRKLFAAGLDVGNGSRCTDCHFPGDSNHLAEGGTFVKYGHGKSPIGFGCSSCHSVNADHDPVSPANGTKMLAVPPDRTQSKYGKDLGSICKTCHAPSQYRPHGSGANSVGCLDCHDEHAEGSGSTSNRFMVPQRLPNNFAGAELSFFQSDGAADSVMPGVSDYYVLNGNARKEADMSGENSAGVCDNALCHAGQSVTGTPFSPLSTFMASGKHTGANRSAGSDCRACHTHNDPAGSWRASNSCTNCHGQPPLSTATSASGYLLYVSNADESKTPHARHVADYGYGCRECHFQYTNAATHDTAAPTYESVWFDPARNPDAAAYPSTTDYTVATSTCNNLYCHSDGQRHAGPGASSTGSAAWMASPTSPDWSAQNLGCNACHGTSSVSGTVGYGAPDHPNGTGGHTANSHAAHAYACAVCHNDTIRDASFADGWSLAAPLNASPHVDGTIDVKADGLTATFTPAAGGTCANISCHGGDSATWGGVAVVPGGCDDCHGNPAAGSAWPDGSAYPDRAGDHQRHIDAIAAAMAWTTAPQKNSSCVWCHPNPGGANHDTDTAGSPANTADVHGDPQNRTTTFRNIAGAANTSPVNATYDSAPGANGKDCSNVDCHYRRITPTTGVATAGGDGWYQPLAAASCSSCHQDGSASNQTGPGALPNAHRIHVAPLADGGRNLACTQCHPSGTYANGHQDGTVQVAFGAGTLGEPGGVLAASSADGTVKYGAPGAYAVCSNLFCHGADTIQGSAWRLVGGTCTAPGWNRTEAAFPGLGDGRCGTCHDTGTQAGESSPGTVLSSGNHPAHLTAASGPNFNTATLAASCDQCHPVYTAVPYGSHHVNGTVEFQNLDSSPVPVSALGATAETTDPPATSTDRCTNCHSTATVAGIGVGTELAKANWPDGTYRLHCLACHNAVDPASSTAAGGPPLAPAQDTNWFSRGHGNTTSYPWVPNRGGAHAACADCHAAAAAHLDGALGQNRLTTIGNGLCNNCHDGAGSGTAVTRVSTHANTSQTMGNPPASYTARRAPFELDCVECHDAHGTANIAMVNATASRFQGTVVFTDNALGADYAVTVANANKICQTCHTRTGEAGTEVYRHNTDTTGHATEKCTGCHGHDIDASNAANSQDGFMPRRVISSGDCVTCHDAAAPYDPGVGKPAAPGIDLAVWSQSGHGKAAGPAVNCTDCHDILLPGSPQTHLDGVYNSIWENGPISTRNTNTAHLRPEFFAPVTSVGPGNWNVQVTFDNRCYTQCHVGKLVRDMRHMGGTDKPDMPHYWSVQMGTKGSNPDGDRKGPSGNDLLNMPFPIDCDLTTVANCSDVDFAPCVSCHDPHGTSIVDPANPAKNYMVRRKWKTLDADPFLCGAACH